MTEIRDAISSRARQIALLIEQIADRQAEIQRLMTERSTLESEIRGLEEGARLKGTSIPRGPANDD